jgi:ribosome-binding factor A
MAGHRSERAGERIHQEISLMLDRDVSDPRLANVNVTRVEVTGDLRIAKVYVTPRDRETDEKEMLDALTRAAGFFRRQLAASLDLRYAPEIRFYLDRSIEAGEHFLQVLDQVQKEERGRKRGTRTDN